jgi:hypothetical protein
MSGRLGLGRFRAINRRQRAELGAAECQVGEPDQRRVPLHLLGHRRYDVRRPDCNVHVMQVAEQVGRTVTCDRRSLRG